MRLNFCGEIVVLLSSFLTISVYSDGPSFDFVEAIEEVETIAPGSAVNATSSQLVKGSKAYDEEHTKILATDFSVDCELGEKCVAETSDNHTEGEILRLGLREPIVLEFSKTPYRCRCDLDDCVDYGDCCHSVLVNQTVKKERKAWRCNKFHEKVGTNVLMISECPPESSPTLAELCAADPKDVDIDYTYLIDIPVYSTATKYLYRNIYCARCHREKNPALIQWKTRLYCNVTMTLEEQDDFIQNATYAPGQRYLEGDNRLCAIYISDLLNSSVKMESVIPNIRYCGSGSIETCPKNYGKNEKQRKTALLCSSYTQHVKARSNLEIFKNPHCALCNGVQPIYWQIERNTTLSNFRCYSGAQISLIFTRMHNRPTGPHGIQLLFDFSLDSHENVVGYDTICEEDQIWDYLHKRCQTAMCQKGYYLRDESCHPLSTDDFSPESKDYDHENHEGSNGTGVIFHGKDGAMNSTCMRILLFEGEYSFISKNNTSIIINSTSKLENPVILHEFEYEFWNDTTLAVCAKDLHEGFMSRFSTVLNYVSAISLALSVIFSFVHVLLYMLLPKLRNLPGKNLLCLTISLLISQLIFLTLINHSRWHGLCVAAAIAVHYFYLAAFFWMNVMSFDMWRTFSGATILSRNQSLERKQITFLKYSVFSWITPLVIVSIAILVEFLPEADEVGQDGEANAVVGILHNIRPLYGQNGFCWIGQRFSLFVFFAAPVALIVISNLLLFSLTAKAILSQNKEAGRVLRNKDSVKAKKDMHGNKDVVKAKLYAKLALIMGLTWILGFLSNFSGWNWLWIVFVLFNGLQGTFIFFAFDFKWKILEMLVEKGRKIPFVLFFMKFCKCVKESEDAEKGQSSNQTGKTFRSQTRSISFSGTTSTYLESK